MQKLETNTLGLAGEYVVASQLCRYGIDAQITLGHAKRTDILAYSAGGTRVVRIEVKSKQGPEWPNQKGVSGPDVLLVFVDFHGKGGDERPDFYILTPEDWKALVHRICGERIERGDVRVNEENIPIWVNQVGKSGRPYEGIGVRPPQVGEYRESWDKIKQMLEEP